ncbi:AtzE family amidohydrolase [Halotia wernerae UHCC 0503]|nr:AtzE family amidohydrolase [Halotia wernerae UHCC 0503]
MTPIELSAHEIARRVASGGISARTIVETMLVRIASQNPEINAFTDVIAGRALAQADAIDAKRAKGEKLGPLAGVPYAVKNLFDIEGLPTRAGSKINRDLAPAKRDSFLGRRMNEADAICLGGLNMGEYAYDFTGENEHDGPSRNPHDRTRMTGGSSGGSGAAVASGMVPVALGSDTNGSIRVPGALCGIFGLKPTYGRLGRSDTFPFVGALDHLGPFARSAKDLALVYDALQGTDEADAGQTPRPAEPCFANVGLGGEGLRIAVGGGYFAQSGEPPVFDAVARAAKALNATREAILPEAHRARAAAYTITTIEGAQLHEKRLRERAADFDPATRDRLLAGLMVPAAWYVKAQRFRRWYADQVLKLFADVDAILLPATPCSAPKLGQVTMNIGGQEMLVRPNLGIYTQPISFIGLPVALAPIHTKGAMPLGVQIVAAPWREDIALRVAFELERQGIATAPVAGI